MTQTLTPSGEDAMTRFDIYSRTGSLLDSKATQVEAERCLGAWFNAYCVIEVLANGQQEIVAVRKELDA